MSLYNLLGTDTADAAGVNGLATEDLVLLSFDGLEHRTLNHTIFVQELLTVFKGLGLAERRAVNGKGTRGCDCCSTLQTMVQ